MHHILRCKAYSARQSIAALTHAVQTGGGLAKRLSLDIIMHVPKLLRGVATRCRYWLIHRAHGMHGLTVALKETAVLAQSTSDGAARRAWDLNSQDERCLRASFVLCVRRAPSATASQPMHPWYRKDRGAQLLSLKRHNVAVFQLCAQSDIYMHLRSLRWRLQCGAPHAVGSQAVGVQYTC